MIVHEIDIRDYYLYLLIDPRDDSVKYVGSTGRVEGRYQDHVCGNHATTQAWVSEVQLTGREIVMKVVGCASQQDRLEKEQALINQYTNLLNVTNPYPHISGNGKRRKENFVKVSVYAEDRQRLKVFAAQHGLTLANAFERLLGDPSLHEDAAISAGEDAGHE